MRTCPECRITVGDPVRKCPVCGSDLIISADDAAEERLYPDFNTPKKPKSSFPFLARLFTFISLIAISVTGLVNLLTAHRLTWSLYVISSILLLWMTVGLHLLTRFNLNNMLLVDFCALSLFLILVDRLSGWYGWSVDYVIPILYIGIMITTVILALVFRVYWREYILSLIAGCVLGIGPLLIFFFSESPMRYLCLAAALLAGALLTGLLFFAKGKLSSEWRRKMNL